jgi:hypothetical protein
LGYKGVINLSGFGTDVIELVAPATSYFIMSKAAGHKSLLVSASLSTHNSSFSFKA